MYIFVIVIYVFIHRVLHAFEENKSEIRSSMRRRDFRLFACEFRFTIACSTVERERGKEMRKTFHFQHLLLFSTSRAFASPANNASTDDRKNFRLIKK